ncbi:MAG: TSUP family transporter [Eubacteriales bacterium]|nr:TSUP family transporter [Eubacteriales bacterium]
MKKGIKKAAAGILSGLIAGFFGSGGGIAVVEGLEQAGLEERRAHATSLAVIFPICAVSAALYVGGGFVPLTETLYLCGGAAIGGLLGAFLLGRIKTRLLNGIFTLLMLTAGIRLLF